MTLRRFVMLAAVAAAGPAPAADPPAKIVLVATAVDHAWNTHMYREECRLLAKCLTQTPGVEAVVSPEFDWPADPKLLAGVRAVVYYSKPAGEVLFAPDRRGRTAEVFKTGVGYAAVHWATGARSDAAVPAYLDLLGGYWRYGTGKLKVGTFPMVKLAPDHPVCRGWELGELRDEIYLDPTVGEKAVPLLKAAGVSGKDQTVAWAFDRPDGGRSFGTTLGHFHDNFKVEAFRRMVVNGILWAAKVEVPAGGAPVAATDEDFVLPPEPAKPAPKK
jgi:type 1 glutamine amidotransferase